PPARNRIFDESAYGANGKAMSAKKQKKTVARVALCALAAAGVIATVSLAITRRSGAAPAPVASTFASARYAHPRPIPLAKTSPSAAPSASAAGTPSTPQPIRTLAELDTYLEGQLMYAQYEPSAAGDIAEEAIGLMNSLTDELGGIDSVVDKEKAFIA